MKVFRGIENLQPIKNPVVTVGTFDGVHAGHKQILDRLNELARQDQGESLLITFWPHPRMVLQPDDNGLKLLNTMEEKVELLEKAGLQNLLIVTFTLDFSRTTYLDFVRDILANGVQTQRLVIGYDHQFGKNREGSYEQLEELAPVYGFKLEEIPAQHIDEVAVSSTKIRKALMNGEVDKANKFLKYNYFVQGFVVDGDKMGRQLGYPTANIQLSEDYKLLPADGVYVVEVVLDNENFYGMLNTGVNPTVEGKGRTMEVHLFNFDEDIYGKKLRVHFLYRLRNELKFDTIDELKDQMEADQHDAYQLLQEGKHI